MGLDSVEMVIGLEDAFGVTIRDAEAEALRTPREVVELISKKLGAVHGGGRCPTQRAFHRLRSALVSAAPVCRSQVSPGAQIRDLLPRPDRRRLWEEVRRAAACPAWPSLGFGWGVDAMRKSMTVAEVARWLDDHNPKPPHIPGEPWTREEVRAVVRKVVVEQCRAAGFSDDADFIEDIGID